MTSLVLERACRPTPAGGKQSGLLVDPAALAAAPREVGLRALASLLRQVSGAVYRPRFDLLERLWGQLATDNLGGGATFVRLRLAPGAGRGADFWARDPEADPRKGAEKGAQKPSQSAAKFRQNWPPRSGQGC